jgi:Serine aminopeptidase, S33
VRRFSPLVACALLAGCGGSKSDLPNEPPPALSAQCGEAAEGIDAKPFWFRASDKALLNGVAIGRGDTAVVLAHGYPSDLDLEAASEQARRRGAGRVFLMGGSYGGAAVLWAGAEMGDDLAGIVDLSGPTDLFNAIGLAPKITAPLLVVASRHDSVVSPKDSRELVAAAGSEDKEGAIYPGGWHAQDLLYGAPYREKVDALIMDFLGRDSD